jgi:hypothetical protein
LVLLKPAPLVFTLNMDVTALRILGEIPVSWTFAMAEMPPGQSYTMPSSLQAWSVHDPKNVMESAAFERALKDWNSTLPPPASADETAARNTRPRR